MYTPSKYNIISRLKNRQEYFIVNILSRNADILEKDKAEQFLSKNLNSRGMASDDIDAFREKGYVVDPREEEKAYKNAYLDFLDLRDSSEVQIFFVPTYACNFACSYCYQNGYEQKGPGCTPEVLDSFFSYVDQNFQGKSYYFTLFGGEPLLPGVQARERVASFVEGVNQRGRDFALVTNGYLLEEYMDIFRGSPIREVQVTLDGTKEVHDRRRPLHNGKGSFDAIVRGIDAVLAEGFPVNLRVVVDKENIGNLPALASFAKEKGWLDHSHFKTQLGRNYELHFCQENNRSLFSRLQMYRELYDLIQGYPEFLEFHRPAFSVSRFLFENGELPEPLFDSCPGGTTEWAFDYHGDIYSCTATVGKQEERLGTFFPKVTMDREQVDQWEERDVTTIPLCGDCSLQLACGGGCASVAKNRSGLLISPDCRPVKELLELGISAYFGEED